MAVSRINEAGLNVNQYGNRNLIINGAMQVAQHGTSTTASGAGAYSSPDRFRFQTNKNTDSVISQVSDAPDGFNYSLKVTVGTGATPSGTDFARLYHRNEGYDAKVFNLGSSSSKAITLSFYVKSSLTGTFGVTFAGDGNGSFVSSYVINSANTWEFKTVSIPAGVWTTYNGSTTNGIGFQVAFDLGEGPDRSNAAGYSASVNSGSMGLTGGIKLIATSSATWQLTGVQLEVGDTATDFEHRSYGDELARCQRYCLVLDSGIAFGTYGFVGFAENSTTAKVIASFPVHMRSAPSLTRSGSFTYDGASGNPTISSTGGTQTPYCSRIEDTVSGATQGEGLILINNNDSDAKLTFDAEL